jgi:curved DNA-binding protein CbpA
MRDPFEELGLPSDADEAQIRRRYLELVREFPPDRAPERFAEIHAAYEQVRDPARRLKARILEIHPRSDSLESVEARLRERLRDARIPVSVLVAWADSA